MIGRQCKGCGIGFEVPEPPARGSSREWCTEACNRRTQRDRRTLELAAIFEDALRRGTRGDLIEGINRAGQLLGPEIARALERQRVMLERTQPKPKRARRARKGAPSQT